MPERQIPLRGRLPYEVAAHVLAIIAFPEADDDRLSEVANRLCSWFVYEVARRALPLGIDPEPIIRPRYAMIPEELVSTEIADLCRQLERRLVAGHIAVGVLQGAAPERPISEPELLGKRTVSNLIGWYAQEAGIDADNLRKRTLQPSRPVIHLAAAWAVMIQDQQRARGKAWDVFQIMLSLDPVVKIIIDAQSFEPLVDKIPSLKSASAALIRLQLVD